MVKLTYAQIRDPGFNPVLNKIANSKMPFKNAKRILGLLKDIREYQEKSDKEWKKLSDMYLEAIPEAGGYLRVKESLSEEDKKLAETTVNEFHETIIEIQKPRIQPDEMRAVELAPSDIMKIDGLIEND